MRSLAFYLTASVSSIIDAHGGSQDALRTASATAMEAARSHHEAGVRLAAAEWHHVSLKIDACADHLANLSARLHAA